MDLSTARRLTAAVTAAVALVYVLIGVNVITVIEGQGPGPGVPPLVAAGFFTVLTVLVAAFARRSVYLGGAALQLIMIGVYFMVSVERVPAFEAWGIGLKVVQGGLLVVFTYLGLRRTGTTDTRTLTRHASLLRLLVVAVVGASALVGGGVAITLAETSTDPGDPATTPFTDEKAPHVRPGASVRIECGGYDETGALVRPEAAAITHARVDASGRLVIPEVCGGYSPDGFFVGDD